MLALSGRAAERDLDDLLLVRLPAPPEGRRAPLQVMDGNYQRLSGVCRVAPLKNVSRRNVRLGSKGEELTTSKCFPLFIQ